MLNTIVAFSDSHNMPLPKRLIDVANESKYVFFLGDGISGLGDILLHKQLHVVRGNCDRSTFPDEEIVEIDGVRILLTHGDKYHVKRDLLTLAMRAKELACQVVFYGHTHIPCIEEYEGITLVCAGAVSSIYQPTYVYATVYNTKFSAKIVNLI